MEDSGRQHKQEHALRAVEMAAFSGFLEDYRSLQESCLVVCNSCRACVPWRYMRIESKVPSTLLGVFWPDLVCVEGERASRVLPPRRVQKVDWRFHNPHTLTYSVVGEKEEEEEEEEEEQEEQEEEDGEEKSVEEKTEEGEASEKEEADREEEVEGEEGKNDERETEEKQEQQAEEKVEKDNGDSGPVASCDIDMSKVRWPAGVKEIFLCGFNQRVDDVVWPACLEVLSFHVPLSGFNEFVSIKGVMGCFNIPLDRVTFPAGLREISLGIKFNQPIDGVTWPAGLARLSMPRFNQPINNVQWPSGLKRLDFMKPYQYAFEEALDDMLWLKSDGGFDEPLGTFLPLSLETLWLSNSFDQPLRGVTWPSGLAVLGLGAAISEDSIDGVEWPPSLRTLVHASGVDVDNTSPGCQIRYVGLRHDSDTEDDKADNFLDSLWDVDQDDIYDSSEGDFSL